MFVNRARWRRSYLGLAGGLGGLFGLLAGCEDPAARERIARREENIQRTIGMMEEIEETNPRAMGWALEALAEQHELDIVRSAENPHKVNAMIVEEFLRFQEKQPRYREEIDRQFRGDVENIERTLPEMLY